MKPLPLVWTAPTASNEEISYDHVIAQTPFGRILITWKGWKKYAAPTVDEHPVAGFVGHAGHEVEDVKRDAELAYFDALAASFPSEVQP